MKLPLKIKTVNLDRYSTGLNDQLETRKHFKRDELEGTNFNTIIELIFAHTRFS